MNLLNRARTPIGAAVIGLALIGGGTATAAVVTSSPATDEVSDVAPVVPTPTPTEPTVTATPEAPAVVQAPVAPVAPAAVDTPAASVGGVTTPAAVEPAPAPDPSIGTTDAKGIYTPAIPVRPGEPPIAPNQAPPTLPDNNPPISIPTDGPATIG